MKHILLIGASPLPTQKEGIREAAGLRTQQFIDAIKKEKKYDISIILITPDNEEKKTEFIDGHTCISIGRQNSKLKIEIREYINKNSFDACIGINTFPSFIAAQTIPKTIPFWADLNGWIMSEAHIRAVEMHHSDLISNAKIQEETILRRADHISTVSTAQKYATYGELASLGKLNHEYWGDHVTAVPNATRSFTVDEQTNIEKVERQYNIPQNKFIIAFIGGYNNWVDEENLFSGVENAMKQDKDIIYISTGGKIKNIAGSVFDRFQKRIESSKYKDRFHFLGWIENEDISSLYAISDIGINIDIDCVETLTGARNRINEMMKFGVPVITTQGSEIASHVKVFQTGITVPSGSSEDITRAILQLVKIKKSNDPLLQTIKENAKRYTFEIQTPENTLIDLTEWLNNLENIQMLSKVPCIKTNGLRAFITSGIRYAKANGIKKVIIKVLQKLS